MKNRSYICYIVIFLFTFTYFCFLGNSNYLIADDTIFHTSNILVMADNISFSNLIPDRIMPTLVNDLGYGINLFYPMFPHLLGAYLVKVFSIFNLGVISVMKFIHFMVIFLSGVLMYRLVFKMFKSKKQALLSAVLYQSAPYMFTDVFMRGALNESFIFLYLPIIFLGLYYLFEENNYKKFYFYFIIGYSLLIYTHLVLTIYLTILLIPFLLIYYKKLFTKKTIMCLGSATAIVLLLTCNFWAPLLEHQLLHNYYILNLEYVDSMDVQIAGILYYFFPLKFFNVREDYFLLFFISPIAIFFICCIYGMIYKKKINKKDRKILISISVFITGTILIACSSFIWKVMPNILKNIQFSWRLAIFVAFGVSILGGYGLRLFKFNTQKKLLILVIILGAFSNFYLTSKLTYVDSRKKEFLRDDCCGLQWSYEYLPTVAKVNSLYLYNKEVNLNRNHVSNIKIIENNVPYMKFEIYDIDKSINIEFPRIYYLGYELTNEKGKSYELYQNNFGLLESVVDEDGIYELKYTGTIVDRITKIVSLLTFVVCFIGFCYNKKIRR